ncbi:putative protein bicaudal C [Cricetulus griseus]|nr:putative protein bicaudal C [Cricetulus griseus]
MNAAMIPKCCIIQELHNFLLILHQGCGKAIGGFLFRLLFFCNPDWLQRITDVVGGDPELKSLFPVFSLLGLQAGHSVVELGWKPIFSTVMVLLYHDNEWRSLQLTKGIGYEDGSEETAQTSCCVQALSHTEGDQPGQVKFIKFLGAEGIASKKDQQPWDRCSDPHIKVSGKKDDVKEAKEMIMSVLDTKGRVFGMVNASENNPASAQSNRVTLKMDVSHTEHSHVIGKGGNNIKKVMEETGCHIHFPDSNRNNQAEKSNQGCLPLVLMFDMKEEIEVDPQFIAQLMEQLDVFISIKPKPKQPSKSVIVKSVERNALNMYEARKCLLGLESSGVSIATSLSPASCPAGLACPSLDILASAGLGLTGLGLLGPTTLSLNTSSTPNSLLNALNSSVSPLQSSSSGTPSPTLWAPSIANTTSATGFSAIPHLMIPSTAQATLTNILLSGVPTYGHTAPSPPPGLTPVDVHINSMQTEGKNISASLNGHVQPPNMKYGALSTSSLGEKVLSGNHGDPAMQTAGPEQASPKSNSVEGCNDAFVEVGMPRSPSHSGNAGDLKQMLGPSKVSCAKRQTVELLQGTKNSHLHSTDRLLSDPELSATESPLADKKAPGSERAAERAAAQQNSERARLASQPPYVHMQAFDYEQKKLLATKAMLKKPVVTEVRTPTNTWSGLGFSKSMPAETIKELRRANHVSYKPTMTTAYEGSSLSLSRSSSREHLASGSESDNWRDRNGIGPMGHSEFGAPIGSPKRKQNKSREHYLSSSNYMDCISSLTGSNGCNLSSCFKGSDLPELFSKLGLGKYTDVFQQQEIDLQTFLTLTDQDLKELGITTFGARRKMLLAISELSKNRRKLFEPSTACTSFLEGGASGRLPRQYHSDIASVSGRW